MFVDVVGVTAEKEEKFRRFKAPYTHVRLATRATKEESIIKSNQIRGPEE